MTDGYNPDFDLDREYGEEAEGKVRGVLYLTEDRIEVKHKRREDWAFYVETAHWPKGDPGYKASGINTTKADYWAYEINNSGVIVLIPVPLLKRAARDAPRVAESDGDNPTKGRLVKGKDIFTPEVSWPPSTADTLNGPTAADGATDPAQASHAESGFA